MKASQIIIRFFYTYVTDLQTWPWKKDLGCLIFDEHFRDLIFFQIFEFMVDHYFPLKTTAAFEHVRVVQSFIHVLILHNKYMLYILLFFYT